MRIPPDLNRELRAAHEEIRRRFPFQNYITETAFREAAAAAIDLKPLLGHFRGKRLLDIGSGPMEKTAMFRLLGFECAAADDLTDPWHVRDDNTAKILQFARDLGIDFHHQSAGDYSLPWPPQSFDVVCSFNIIEHLHGSPRDLLNTMGTLAVDGGLIVVMMPNAVNLRKRLDVLRGRTNYVQIDQYFHQVGAWRGHVREYTLADTEYICRETGFEIVTSHAFESLAYDVLKPPIRQVYLALTKFVPTAQSSLLVVAKKPKGWQPLPADENRFRKAVARFVPEGVR